MPEVPVIDLSGLDDVARAASIATDIDRACRDTGFFCVVGHGVPAELRRRVESLATEFFELPALDKARLAMPLGGRAWRGWFPLGGELTSGVPDGKEGVYFGQELGADDPRVVAGVPLHGANLFPDHPAGLRDAVLEYMSSVAEVGRRVLRGVALGLGLELDWFEQHLTAEPLVLFRIFRYPPMPPDAETWGVAEHTDYGLLTILGHDGSDGLQVRSNDGWMSVTADPDAFVVNIGDMLDRMTGGVYRSTAHRVRNSGASPRLSFPLFLDPGWDAEVLPVPSVGGARLDDAATRWDGRSVHEWSGTYGDYLLTKVGKVFPDLHARVVDDS